MPMDFPEMSDLLRAAEVHKFRHPNDGETEAEFREALADHVKSIDLIESQEIRTGKGWHQWGDSERADLLSRL